MFINIMRRVKEWNFHIFVKIKQFITFFTNFTNNVSHQSNDFSLCLGYWRYIVGC